MFVVSVQLLHILKWWKLFYVCGRPQTKSLSDEDKPLSFNQQKKPEEKVQVIDF